MNKGLRLEKGVIDKWISEESLKRMLQDIKSVPFGKSGKIKEVKRLMEA